MFQPACICDLLFISNCCAAKKRIELFTTKKVLIPSVENAYIFYENLFKSYQVFNVAASEEQAEKKRNWIINEFDFNLFCLLTCLYRYYQKPTL
jgi:hypothetical protein